jgi:hypothetical protein
MNSKGNYKQIRGRGIFQVLQIYYSTVNKL